MKDEIKRAREALQSAGLYLPTPRDYERLATAAADAYTDYPLFTHVCKDGIYNAKVIKSLYHGILKILSKSEIACCESEECKSLAIWQAPGISGTPTIPFMLAGGGLKLCKTAGIKSISRLIQYENFAEPLRRSITKFEDWHLSNLTVSRDSQRKGFGTALLTPMLQFCQENKRRVCLETNKTENMHYYERFGFKVAAETKIPGSEIVHYCMLKEPI